MQPNPSLQKLVTYLQGKGFSEDKISDIGVELTKNAFMLLYTNAMAAFTEEDIKAIEDCESDEKANEKIVELYSQRTGKKAEEELSTFLTKVADEYIASQEKEATQQPAVS